jgi:hypothetical protein
MDLDLGGQCMTVPPDPDQSRSGILETRILLLKLGLDFEYVEDHQRYSL